jgi:enoyl-CoA hydratase
VKAGFAAGDGGAVIWPHLIGHARAKEYLMTGRLLMAEEAEKIGLINHVVPAEDIDRVVDAFAQELLGRCDAAQFSGTKLAVNYGTQAARAFGDGCFHRFRSLVECHRWITARR